MTVKTDEYYKILNVLCESPEEFKSMPDEKSMEYIEIVSPDSIKITEVKKLKPHISRVNMSKYEFAGVITKLALYLNTLSSIDDYIEEVQVNGFINNSQLAYKLLMNHKFDAILDRLGYEFVSFSELRINPLWCSLLEHYYARSNKSLEEQCYSQLYNEKFRAIFN